MPREKQYYAQHKPRRAQRARSSKSAPAEKIAAPLVEARPRSRLIEGGSHHRKTFPITTGLLDYFPDACAAVAEVSYLGNEKHNPGEVMHHARGKSMDHADCIGRHLIERGGFDTIVIKGVEYRVRHSAAMAWRSFALLQEELEGELNLPLPRAARA